MNMVKLIKDFLGGAVLSTFHTIGGGGRKNAAHCVRAAFCVRLVDQVLFFGGLPTGPRSGQCRMATLPLVICAMATW